jgi:hypothetical protein
MGIRVVRRVRPLLLLASLLGGRKHTARVLRMKIRCAHIVGGRQGLSRGSPPEDIERRIKEALATRANEARPPLIV